MRKSVFYSLKTFTQGRLPSADASTKSISYKVDGSGQPMYTLPGAMPRNCLFADS